MDIQKELSEVIKKNLPAALGEELQKRLKELEDKEKAYEDLRKEHGLAKEQRDLMGKKVDQLREENDKWEKRRGVIEEMEEDVRKRELFLDKTLLATQLAEAEKRATGLYELVGIIFRNPVVKKHVIKSGDIVTNYGKGGVSYNTPGPNTKESTTEEIE